MADNNPPEDVKRAAAIVDRWVTEQEQPQARVQPQRVDAFDKFMRHVREDAPKQQPAWKDPRPEVQPQRWRR
jgi:hypothetical protein